MIHAYSICSHPGVDIRWTISKFITRMGISLKIPYSIYFRMIIYIYIYIDNIGISILFGDLWKILAHPFLPSRLPVRPPWHPRAPLKPLRRRDLEFEPRKK
jgi:hypothetical protein